MKIFFLTITVFCAHIIFSYGQNTSPFWSVAGNSNASLASKLGTTNAQPLRFFTNNLERIRVAINGNIGIGTLASDYKTSIYSNKVESNNNTHVLRLSGRNPVLLFTNENNLSNGYIKSWTNAPFAPFTNGMVIGSNPGYPIFLSTNYGPTMTIANSNNVGIGTATPQFKLEVKSSVVASNNNTNLLKLTGRNQVLLFSDENTGYGYIKSWTNAPYAPFTKGMIIGSNPGYPIFLSTNYGATMTVATNDCVGIGTTMPAFKLEVKSSVVQSNNNTHVLKLTGRNPVLLFSDENNVANGYIKSWTNGPYAPFTNGMLIGSNPGYPIFFSTNYGATMTIANNNNVGIGTTNPVHKLSVNGTIQAKEVRVESGWADCVFEKDYQLQSLDNVATYIKREKHLPGIPSAKEIRKNGLAVGEVQTKMMEKIEELTLYLIDLKVQIEQLQKDNEDLKTKIVKY